MRPFRELLGGVALLAMVHAGSIRASAEGSSAEGWVADPDEQLLLEVTIRDLRLGDGVRAYRAPEGTCLILSDFLTTLDVPMTIDVGKEKVEGWAFKETNRISIDRRAMRATFGKASESFSGGVIRDTSDGWCVQADSLARWFGIGIRAQMSGSSLRLRSDARLPVELARLRQMRAALRPARIDIATLPRAEFPYQLWRTPTADVVSSVGFTKHRGAKVEIDRRASIFSAGEVARMSFLGHLATDENGVPASARLSLFRSDPDAQLLGPAKATHFGVGDVEGFASKLGGSATYGRGAVVTNRPVGILTAFDKSHFEGDLPAGWDAEIYRNNELLEFAKSTPNQRYSFDDVPLFYGENRIRIVLYGPQGQIREREEVVNVGNESAPPGKLWYWAGVSQPGHDLVRLHRAADGTGLPRSQATVAIEYGIDQRTSLAAVTRAVRFNQQQLIVAEATLRRSIGMALVEVGAARESTGGTAARAQLLGKIGPAYVNAEAVIASDFHLRGARAESRRDYRLGVDVPLKIGKQELPIHADVYLGERADGVRNLEATGKLSTNISRFNLSAIGRYRHVSRANFRQADRFTLDALGSGRIGKFRIRTLAEFDISPVKRLQTADVSASWSAGRNVDWEGGIAYDAPDRRTRARVSYGRRFGGFGVALTGEAGSDRSLAAGINLNFSLDPSAGLRLSRRPLAQAGIVRATVYRDLNGNGYRDPMEPPEADAVVMTGRRPAEEATDKSGKVTIAGLTPYAPVVVAIDQSSLSDPRLAISKASQVVVPRQGVASDVEIGLVGGGDVEGALVRNGGLGFEGLDLELVDASGRVVATTRSDFDGFFLFERVAYGHYTVRLASDSAAAAKVDPQLNVSVDVSEDKAVARIGSIAVRPATQIAALDPH